MHAGIVSRQCRVRIPAMQLTLDKGSELEMTDAPRVSVLLPAYRAHAHIARAIRSLLDQTFSAWEAIIASDDGVDYLALLGGEGSCDPRVRQVFTGQVRSGVASARNVALHSASARFIAALDCDDLFHPQRFEKLLPIAEAHGAVIDNVAVVEEGSGQTLGSFLPANEKYQILDVQRFLQTNVPAKPIFARNSDLQWDHTVGISDDVVFVLRLMEKFGPLAYAPELLQEYRVRVGSECHRDDSCEMAEAGYQRIIGLVEEGTLGRCDAAFAVSVRQGIEQKRKLNFAYDRACRNGFSGTFQHFACSQDRSPAIAT